MQNNTDFHGNIKIKDRELLEIEGIISIAAFDESYVLLNTDSGVISVEGDGMKIEDMSSERGSVRVVGKINSIAFEGGSKKRGLFGVFS